MPPYSRPYRRCNPAFHRGIDLRITAQKRIPKFAFEYLDSATGRELGLKINRDALDAIGFMPKVLCGRTKANLQTTLLGQSYDLPFGVAPVGMSGLMWAGAERLLAQAAVAHNIPFSLSSVAVASPEDVAPHIGNNGWFQHYPVNSAELRRTMLTRVKAAGYHTLIITVDVPEESRRERQRRANLTLVLHKISSPGAYRAVYKALHGVFTGLSLVILSEIQKKRVQRL